MQLGKEPRVTFPVTELVSPSAGLELYRVPPPLSIAWKNHTTTLRVQGRPMVTRFIIQPHGRLQEWIAHEKGYFRDQGLAV